MTRLYTEGAEMRDILFWTYTSPGDVSVVSAAPAPQFSNYCFKVNGTGSCYKQFSALSEIYIRQRIYFEVAASLSTNWQLPAFYNEGTLTGYLTLDASGHIVAKDGGNSTLATSTITLNDAQWYLIEVYFKLADAPNGRFVVYIDAVKDIDFTGDTKYGSTATFDIVQWRTASTVGNNYYMGLDDLAANDTGNGDGKNDNSYCGDGVIIKVIPDGNGAHNNWHGSDGNDINNYELVSEYPNDGDTSYVYHDGSASGTQDQYTLSDYDGTNKTITRIYAEARLRKTAAAAHTVKLGVLPSGSTDQMSSALNLSTSYARYVGNEYKTNPADAGAWEEADIDALEFVVEVG